MPISAEILKRFPNPIFIETGTLRGEGVQAALDAGFECIYSVDISAYCHGWCQHRFWDYRSKVNLYERDSRRFLKWLMPKVTTRCTFWLDAHFCFSEGGRIDDVPLLQELRIIDKHQLHTHTILIDDIRLMGTRELPVSFKKVRNALLRINPNYTITRIDSPEFKEDILVAELCPPSNIEEISGSS